MTSDSAGQPVGGLSARVRSFFARRQPDRQATEPVVAPPPGNPRFRLFDSLRAIAALSVLLAHAQEVSSDPTGYESQLGALGVTIFFLVSGFLLYRPFVAARWAGRPRPRLRDYARRRILRIVPAYWLALTIIGTGRSWGCATCPDNVFNHEWLAVYGFGQIYSQNTFALGIGPAWTLCVEVTFYLVLPFLAFAVARWGPSGKTVRGDVIMLLALSLASIAFHAGVEKDRELFQWASTIFGSFLWFALGMGLAVASVALNDRTAPPRVVTLVVRRPGLFWLLAAAMFWFVCTQMTALPGVGTGGWKEHMVYGLAATFLLLPAVFGENAGGVPRWVLGLRWLSWIGLVSYGVYLWHVYVIGYFVPESFLRELPDPWWGLLAISLVTTLLIAAASYYLVERPLLRFKYLKPRRRPEDPSAATAPAP